MGVELIVVLFCTLCRFRCFNSNNASWNSGLDSVMLMASSMSTTLRRRPCSGHSSRTSVTYRGKRDIFT